MRDEITGRVAGLRYVGAKIDDHNAIVRFAGDDIYLWRWDDNRWRASHPEHGDPSVPSYDEWTEAAVALCEWRASQQARDSATGLMHEHAKERDAEYARTLRNFARRKPRAETEIETT